MKICKFILLNLSILLLGSCAKESGMRIRTNTFANKEEIPEGFKEHTTFSISTKQKGDRLFSREVSQKIAAILKDKGFTVKTTDNADYALNFSFGITKSTHTRDVPVYIPNYGPWYYHRYPHHSYGCRWACAIMWRFKQTTGDIQANSGGGTASSGSLPDCRFSD